MVLRVHSTKSCFILKEIVFFCLSFFFFLADKITIFEALNILAFVRELPLCMNGS